MNTFGQTGKRPCGAHFLRIKRKKHYFWEYGNRLDGGMPESEFFIFYFFYYTDAGRFFKNSPNDRFPTPFPTLLASNHRPEQDTHLLAHILPPMVPNGSHAVTMQIQTVTNPTTVDP